MQFASHHYQIRIVLENIEINKKINHNSVHAYLLIDDEELQFSHKKKTGVFNLELVLPEVCFNYDEITGLFGAKKAVFYIEIEENSAQNKIGETVLNLGAVLNQKKSMNRKNYALMKCHDQNATIKLNIHFKKLKVKINEIKDPKQLKFEENNLFWKSQMKSRLIDEQNILLQNRINDFKKQKELLEVQLHHLSNQLEKKQDTIVQLQNDLNLKQSSINSMTIIQDKNTKYLKQITDQTKGFKDEISRINREKAKLQKQKKQYKNQSQMLQNFNESFKKNKSEKQKHLIEEINKYKAKYGQSQQQRNIIVLKMQKEFQEQMIKKEAQYKEQYRNKDKIIQQNSCKFQDKIQCYANQIQLLQQKAEKLFKDNLFLQKQLENSSYSLKTITLQLTDMKKNEQMKKNQFELLILEQQQLSRKFSQSKQQMIKCQKKLDVVNTELNLANRTIEQLYKKQTKSNKELKIYEERQFYLKSTYIDELQNKSINEEYLLKNQELRFYERLKYKQLLQQSQYQLKIETQKRQQLESRIKQIQNKYKIQNNQFIQIQNNLIHKSKAQNTLKQINQSLQNQIQLLKSDNQYLKRQQENLQMDVEKLSLLNVQLEQLHSKITEMKNKFENKIQSLKTQSDKEIENKNMEILKFHHLLKAQKQKNDEWKKNLSLKQFKIHQNQEEIRNYENKIQFMEEQVMQLHQKAVLNEVNLKQLEQKMNSKIEQLKSNQYKLQKINNLNKELTSRLKYLDRYFQRIIVQILQHLCLSSSSYAVYHEINGDIEESNTINFINITLKKYCQNHNKQKYKIQQLQEQIHQYSYSKNQIHNEQIKKPINFKLQQNNDDQRIKFISQKFNKMNQISQQMQQMEIENDELRRHIQKLEKYKTKIEQQDENKPNTEIKNQSQNLQYQLMNLKQQLLAKEKIITDYQNKIRQIQTTKNKPVNINNNIAKEFLKNQESTNKKLGQLKNLQFKLSNLESKLKSTSQKLYHKQLLIDQYLINQKELLKQFQQTQRQNNNFKELLQKIEIDKQEYINRIVQNNLQIQQKNIVMIKYEAKYEQIASQLSEYKQKVSNLELKVKIISDLNLNLESTLEKIQYQYKQNQKELSQSSINSTKIIAQLTDQLKNIQQIYYQLQTTSLKKQLNSSKILQECNDKYKKQLKQSNRLKQLQIISNTYRSEQQNIIKQMEDKIRKLQAQMMEKQCQFAQYKIISEIKINYLQKQTYHQMQ